MIEKKGEGGEGRSEIRECCIVAGTIIVLPLHSADRWFSRGKGSRCSGSQAKREIKREDYCSISEDYQSVQLEEILECSLFYVSLL
jgi:hypothetical protein